MEELYNHNDLIDGCLRNDRKSQQALYDLFAPKMLAVCMYYATTKHEAEDIMIEGFMQVFTHLEKYLGQGSLEHWIRQIMVNKAISNFRNNNKRYGYAIIDEQVEIADETANIETHLTAQEILKLMQKMPEIQRMVFSLRALEEYSFKEIGQELNITENTARVYFMRAKNWITEEIK